MPHSPSRQNNFDAIRFGLAVLVIFSHSYPIATGDFHTEPLVRWTGDINLGHFAVGGFFSLSGYLIAQSWVSARTIRDFFVRRVSRIYPGFLVCAAICAFVVTPMTSANGFRDLANEELDVTLLGMATLRLMIVTRAFVTNPLPGSVNVSLWTIFFEFAFYIATAAIGLLRLFRSRYAILAITLLMTALAFRFGPGSLSLWTQRAISLAPFYLAGTAFYLFREEIPHTRWLALVCLIALLGSLAIPATLPITMPLAGTYLLFYAGFSQSLRFHHWARYGDFSYGIYLYAWPIQQAVTRISGNRLTPLGVFAIATPIVIVAGVFSWYLVERWFIRRARRAV